MKLFFFATVCLLGASFSAAQTPDPAPDNAKTITPAPPPHAPAPWSVVGKWHCTHPIWTDTITISPDGTFARDQGDAGHWTLTGLRDHFVLVLDWNDWPAENVTMLGPDDFRGKARGEDLYGPMGELSMHRTPAPVADGIRSAACEFRTWRQGEPRVRLIRKEEGFCALSLVTGGFAGGGEVVKVYVDDDGYWYLDGQSAQQGVAAQCIIVRWTGK